MGYGLKILGPFLLEKMALHDVGHILRGHHIPVVVNMAMRAIEAAHINLSHKETAFGTLFGGVEFIHSYYQIAQRTGLNKVNRY